VIGRGEIVGRVREGALATVGAVAAIVTGAVVGLATPAHADTTTARQDETFQRLLAGDGVLFSFPLQKKQGLRACGQEDYGMSGLDAVYQLMRDGSYSFDVANPIVSSAEVAYCPWHSALPRGAWP
jgi:hypothetical protein